MNVKFDGIKGVMAKRKNYQEEILIYAEEIKKRFLNFFEGEGHLSSTDTENLYKITYEEHPSIYFMIEKFSVRGFTIYLSSDFITKEYLSTKDPYCLERGAHTIYKTKCKTHFTIYGDDKTVENASTLYNYLWLYSNRK